MQNLIENKSKIFSRNAIIYLGIIGAVGFLIRSFYFPEGIPVTLDGALYFWYANDLSISGTFPSNVNFPNNGWPTFLSVFFYFFNSENFLDYMDLQRYITITISVATIIPVFILCRKFCGDGLSLIGALLFAFQPRIIENSLSGLADPLFILLELMCLVLFLQKDFKFKYMSFAFLALACIVRYEGIVLIVPLSILFLRANQIDKKIIFRYLLAISIFLLFLLPMISVRMDTMGYDGIASHSIAAVYTIGEDATIYTAILSLIKTTGYAVFPIFFALLPLGFFGFFRNRNFDKYTILLFLIFMLLPIIYASSRGIVEPRYFLTLFPIFSLISVYTVKEITRKFNGIKPISIMIVVAILLSSIVYLDYNKIDYEYELDAYHIGLEVSKKTSGINYYFPEGRYVHHKIDVVSNLGTFPLLSSEIEKKVKLIKMQESRVTVADNDTSLYEFIDYGKSEGLTHIIADENENRAKFLKDIFRNEEKFPYVTKIYDSMEHGYDYHLKIFRINYEKFESMEFN